MRILIFLFCIIISAFSCLNQLDLNGVFDEKIIIEGRILKGEKAQVIITKSISKTDDNLFPIISDAIVTLSSNDLTEQLNYVGDGRYESAEIIGSIGQTYNITVALGGESYIAQSTMPEQGVWIDSLGFPEPIEFDTSNFVPTLAIQPFLQNTSKNTNFGFLRLHINDSLVNNPQYLFFNDRFRNTDFSWTKDTVFQGANLVVQLFQTDSIINEYFYEVNRLNEQINLVGLTIAPPTDLKGNFNNGALGYFGAMIREEKSKILGN